jgi:GNAT superfamily N-acetyltransferase
MTRALLRIHVLTPADWHVLRAMRLRALRHDPRAFTSDRKMEAGWPEQRWRRLAQTTTWIAADRGRPVGIANISTGDDGELYLESVWVEPAHRRHGVFRSMLDRCVTIARESGADRLLLWALVGNVVAHAAYDRLGFRRDGVPQKHASGRWEQRFRLDI